MGSCYIAQGAQPGVLDDLESREEEGGRWEVHRAGGIHTHLAESHCCATETVL